MNYTGIFWLYVICSDDFHIKINKLGNNYYLMVPLFSLFLCILKIFLSGLKRTEIQCVL